MQIPDLSDDGLRFWGAYFLTSRNTLRFGGDHAEMEITTQAHAALDELLEVGAVKTIPADDQWPGREYYGATTIDLRDEVKKRGGKNPFEWMMEDGFVSFKKKAEAAGSERPRVQISMQTVETNRRAGR